jgi:hypothetical protein
MDVVNSPIYATGVGLVLYGAENQTETPRKFRREGMMNRFWKWLGEYIDGSGGEKAGGGVDGQSGLGFGYHGVRGRRAAPGIEGGGNVQFEEKLPKDQGHRRWRRQQRRELHGRADIQGVEFIVALRTSRRWAMRAP